MRCVELLHTVCMTLASAGCNWILGCDANMESEGINQSLWLQDLGVVMVVTDDMADTYRANVSGVFFLQNTDYFMVSKDMVDVVTKPEDTGCVSHERRINQCT